MATRQPIWTLVANLGDASPFEYGGYFVYRDETGIYAPEADYLWINDDVHGKPCAQLHRFILEPCTFIDGVLSDNPFHPTHPVWFADKLADIAQTCDVAELDLLRMFTSSDPLDRAHAWRSVGEYHGFDNLDAYPLTFDNLFRLARYARKYRANLWPKP